ncbi:hypothetical protein Q4E93_34165 [Flavitalea sp. BT771]|uniref:hypothetical protein n=1 Tax=Flavitalea sp. BT771 TaxID=3063329 RepID=UPI0026E1C59E|nr:hypothetical protein [Flavitalea sp. BT771]MDO6435710.1 hypothetical protein [Flavitalea sp. BT771]MDV6224611.1 hypothetical protein [Flavitalea sp. BT771]
MTRLRLYLPIALLLACSGCAYKSIVIHAPAKRNIYLGAPSATLPRSGSILDHPLDLASFYQHPRSSATVDYQGILYNPADGRYLQWQFLRKDLDSTLVRVKFLESNKTQLTDFVMSFSNHIFGRPVLRPVGEGTYLLTLPIDTLQKSLAAAPATAPIPDSASPASLLITRSQNYVLADTLLHLWTGEVDNLHGGKCQFVILNDVEDPKPISEEMFIFTSFLTDMKEWDDKCKAAHAKACADQKLVPHYHAVTKYHRLYTFFSIFCDGNCVPKY